MRKYLFITAIAVSSLASVSGHAVKFINDSEKTVTFTLAVPTYTFDTRYEQTVPPKSMQEARPDLDFALEILSSARRYTQAMERVSCSINSGPPEMWMSSASLPAKWPAIKEASLRFTVGDGLVVEMPEG